MSGGHASNVYVIWTKSLDPASPDFKFNDETLVASTDGVEDCDAIDPSFLLDPATGRLWLSYGTYFGYIRIVEIDPKTGKRVAGNKAVDVAIDMEATDLVARDGWYYLGAFPDSHPQHLGMPGMHGTVGRSARCRRPT